LAETSATPLLRKLGIKPGHRVAFVDAPADFPRALGALPAGCQQMPAHGEDTEPLDVIVCFGLSQTAVRKSCAQWKRRLAPNGGLWLCWPKKASGVATDLADMVVQKIGLDAGLVDNKICAIDATWSAMRFVFRLRDRPRQ
jgi:hypothetical protein